MTKPLPTVPVHAIDPQPDAPQWLVRDLWTTAAVGVIGGSPKVGKSWFGLDLAVSVGKHSVYPLGGGFRGAQSRRRKSRLSG